MYRVDNLTVHTKLMLVDDVFASIGSANFFSRSMVGTDSEITATFITTGPEVRDLRVKLWAEHLRTALSGELTPMLANLDTALGIWRTQWLPEDHPRHTWRRAGSPSGFRPGRASPNRGPLLRSGAAPGSPALSIDGRCLAPLRSLERHRTGPVKPGPQHRERRFRGSERFR
jgi:hypothetical protein